eukprot:2532362-Amphidinium_carterae.1
MDGNSYSLQDWARCFLQRASGHGHFLTPHGAVRGKTYMGDLVPFEEQVKMKDIDGTEAGKLNPRWKTRGLCGKVGLY